MTASSVRAGRFGPYGGRYVPETLIPALDELAAVYAAAVADQAFLAEVDGLAADYIGRPTPSTAPAASRRPPGSRRSTSSARTSTTPAPTRSTTPSGRRSWPGAWGSPASSPRRGPGSTA